MDKGELPSSVHFGLWSQLLLSNCGTPDAWWRMSSLFPPGRKQMPFIFCRWNIEFKKRRHGAIRRLTRRGQVGREPVASQCKWGKQQLQERKRGQNVTQNRANGNGHLPEKFCLCKKQKSTSHDFAVCLHLQKMPWQAEGREHARQGHDIKFCDLLLFVCCEQFSICGIKLRARMSTSYQRGNIGAQS